VAIPAALVIFNELKLKFSPKKWEALKQNIIRITQEGNTLSDTFWQGSQTACPFLGLDGQGLCSIYDMRPISCRAYHSSDQVICKKGFDLRQEVHIPCFPLYKASTDMYTAVLIRMMSQKGLFSYQVGFVRALQILFEDDTALDKWIGGADVFKMAELS